MSDRAIPFDSLVLAGVTREMQTLVGQRLESVNSLDKFTLCFGFETDSAVISVDPQMFRAHMSSLRRNVAHPAKGFAGLCEQLISGRQVESVKQHGFDRVLTVAFSGAYSIVVMLFGPNSKMIFTKSGEVIGGLRNKKIELPLGNPKVASLEEGIKDSIGISPFLKEIAKTVNVLNAFEKGPSMLYPGGAYPFPIPGIENEKVMSSLSIAIEQFALRGIRLNKESSERESLRGVLLSAHKKIKKLEVELIKTIAAGDLAIQNQIKGEILLANKNKISPMICTWEGLDYDGNPISIEIDSKKSVVENSSGYFRSSKKQKSGAKAAKIRLPVVKQKLLELEELLVGLESDDIDEMAEKCSHYVREQSAHKRKREDKPFDGKRIRAIEAPGGWTVLFGDNAEANDYLATRVAKPNDYWFHIRAGSGSHVVLQTNNQPTKVQPDAIRFAAIVAAKNSGQKHAKHVPVDYVLAKNVRKPRKSAPGSVTYTGEKTLFVDP